MYFFKMLRTTLRLASARKVRKTVARGSVRPENRNGERIRTPRCVYPEHLIKLALVLRCG